MLNLADQPQNARRELICNLLDRLGCGQAEIHHVDRAVHHQGNCKSYHFRLPCEGPVALWSAARRQGTLHRTTCCLAEPSRQQAMR